jgi:carboxymethylenebutenolidase
MPIYDPVHIEYSIETGFVQINLDDGSQFRAYMAHPQLAGKYPAISLLHDWWGITGVTRRLANVFAQSGYYVIVPDLFDGKVTQNPREAMRLVESLGEEAGMARVCAAIDVVEKHNHTNGSSAAVGLGMGGSFAYDVALECEDVEAAVSCGGFPQRNMDRFHLCKTPVMALYGKNDPYIDQKTLEQLGSELLESPGKEEHRLKIVQGLSHEFYPENPTEVQREASRLVLREIMTFISKYLTPPKTSLRLPHHRHPHPSSKHPSNEVY